MNGLARQRVMQYRTLHANAPSIGSARSLGYRCDTRTLAVRFTD